MNKEILRQFANLERAIDDLLYAIHDMRKALDNEKKETAWFDNGNIIVNGTKYPIQNFKIEWEHAIDEPSGRSV